MLKVTRILNANVCVIGAAGGIGQPLALLMKLNTAVKNLNLVDIANSKGVAVDLSHIATPAKVQGFSGDDIGAALKGMDIVVVPAGVPRKPGMTRDDLFEMNASVVANVARQVATHCPNAITCIITNPVNSMVPIYAEIFKKHGTFNPAKVAGVTTLDLVRAKAFVHELSGVDTEVPVIGGHSGPTIVPLLSQAAGFSTAGHDIAALTKRIQYAGDEVVNAKAGGGSATLSMAFAGARFANALIKARDGSAVEEYAYVNFPIQAGLDYFASKVVLGADGIVKAHPIGTLSAFETEKHGECVAQLNLDISKGIKWAQAQ